MLSLFPWTFRGGLSHIRPPITKFLWGPDPRWIGAYARNRSSCSKCSSESRFLLGNAINDALIGEQSFHYRADDGTDAFKYLNFRFEDDSAGKPVCQNRVHPITSGMSIVTVLLLAVLDNAEDSCDVTGSKDSDSERSSAYSNSKRSSPIYFYTRQICQVHSIAGVLFFESFVASTKSKSI